jgi:Peroxiredoxin
MQNPLASTWLVFETESQGETAATASKWIRGCRCTQLVPKKGLALGGPSPEIGTPAPNFELSGTNLQSPDKSRWSLIDWKGHWLVLYFYPRDFTSGCTIEAHGFQDSLEQFKLNNCDVAAISADSVEDHESFCSSEELDFTLLSDHDGIVSRSYGSWMAPYSLRHTIFD